MDDRTGRYGAPVPEPEDGALRAFHADLEETARPHDAFRDELLTALETGAVARPTGPRTGLLVAAGLGLLVLTVGLAAGGLLLFSSRTPAPSPPLYPTDSGAAVATLPLVTGAPIGSGTFDPSAGASASETPSPSTTSEATATPAPTASVAPTVTEGPTEAPTVAPTFTPTDTPALTPTPTPPPTPTPTQRPTPSPTPAYAFAGTWTPPRSAPAVDSPRVVDIELAADGLIYALYEGDLQAYDPAADRWTDLTDAAPLPSGIGPEANLTAAADGLLYLFLPGAAATDVYAYDPGARAWTAVGPLDGVSVRDASAMDGRLHFIGSDAGQMVAFAPASRTMEPLASSGGDYGPFLERGVDGRIYVLGPAGLASYEPVADTWRREGDVPISDFGARRFAALTDGSLYLDRSPLAGGAEDPIDLVSWDPERRAWVTVTPPPEPIRAGLVGGPEGSLYALDDRAFGEQRSARGLWVFTPDARR